MTSQILTRSSTNLVTKTEAKNYIKVDFTADDDLIDDMILAAQYAIEAFTGKTLIETKYRIFLEYDELEDRRYTLPFSPHSTVDSVKSVDLDGTETTLVLNSDYYKVGTTKFDLVFMTFVSTTGLTLPNYKIEFTSKWAASPGIPELYKQAVLKAIENFYCNRGSYVVGTTAAKLPDNVKAMLQSEVELTWF
jgi:uncharacterized phiE125 gp8 family phage protein